MGKIFITGSADGLGQLAAIFLSSKAGHVEPGSSRCGVAGKVFKGL